MNDGSIGHNQPPDDGDIAIARSRELIAAAEAWGVIPNADAAAKLGDFLVQLRHNRDDLERVEKALRSPYQAIIEGIRERFRTPRNSIEVAILRVKRLADDWLQRERDRLIDEKAEADRKAKLSQQEADEKLRKAQRTGSIDDEVAARAAMEEADAIADQVDDMPTKASIRSDLSGKAIVGRITWSAEIANVRLARRHYAQHAEVLRAIDDAIVKVATRQAKLDKNEKKAPPGVRYIQTRSVA